MRYHSYFSLAPKTFLGFRTPGEERFCMSSVMMVAGGGYVNFFYIVWDPLKKVCSSPPPINLNGTALMLFIALFEVQ